MGDLLMNNLNSRQVINSLYDPNFSHPDSFYPAYLNTKSFHPSFTPQISSRHNKLVFA